MKTGLVLVEGPSEERFIKDVLAPSFAPTDLYLVPTVIETKRTMNAGKFKGGVSHYGQFKRDMSRLLPSANANTLVTSMIDYYRLPNDFPGMNSRPKGSPEARVGHVQKAIADELGNPAHCLIYLSLHEFEALLFSDPAILASNLLNRAVASDLNRVKAQFATPEHINERPGQNPAGRIESCCPTFQKTVHGVNAATAIGITKMRAECPHFNSWVDALEKFAAA